MEDEELSRILGNRAYKEGLRMYLAGQAGEVKDIGDGLYKVHVSDVDGTDNVVIVGRNGRGFRFHCGCGGSQVCRHEAAAMISVFGEADAEREQETGTDSEENLRFISEEIGRLKSMVDECEYHGSSEERVERMCRMAARICDDIEDTVKEATNAIRLYQDAMDASDYLPYGMESPQEEVVARAPDFAYLLGRVPPVVLADTLERSSSKTWRRSWVLSYLHSIPRGSSEAACDILMERGADPSSYSELLFYLGRYDEYIEHSEDRCMSVIRCMESLESSGDVQGAKDLLPLLPGPDAIPSLMRRDASIVLHRIGEYRASALVLRSAFLDHPSEDGLSAVLEESDSITEDCLIEDAVASVREGRARGYGPLAFLVEHGHGADVCEILDSCDYVPERGRAHASMWIDPGSPRVLYSALVANGFTETAVRMARTHIEEILEARDSRKYDRAVALMVMMDDTAGAEADGLSVEAYRSALRSRYSRLHSFWSRYRDEGGTY